MEEVLNSQAQRHDDVDHSEQSDRSDLLNMGDTQRRRAIQEPLTEGSNSQHKANGVAKPTNQKIKSEENEVDQMKSRASEKIKVHPSSKFLQKLKMEQDKVNNDSEAQYFEEPKNVRKLLPVYIG